MYIGILFKAMQNATSPEQQVTQPSTQPPSHPGTQQKPKRLSTIIVIILLVILIAIVFLYFYLSHGNSAAIPAGTLSGTQQVSTNPSSNPQSQSPTNCQPNDILINPCRPWVGAAAKGNPGAPGQTPPGKDAISQFTYFEQLAGHPMDIYRDYHSSLTAHNSNSTLPFDPNTPAGKVEIQLSNRSNTYVDINWNPTDTWQQSFPVSQGGDPATNANIVKTAQNIKSVAPQKVFLSLWHEPQLNVSTGTNCPIPTRTSAVAGSPAQ